MKNNIIDFVRRERLYLLILLFILTVNAIVLMPSREARPPREPVMVSETPVVVSAIDAPEPTAKELEALRRAELEKLFRQNSGLAVIFGLTSLFIIAIFILGVAIDAILVSIRLSGKRLDISTYQLQTVRWGVWDVAKVIILFIFFGYIVIMIESVLVRYLPILKDDNVRMILNSSVLDILGVIFILYFCMIEHKEKMIALGISMKNFARNVCYGMAGYIAMIPILVGILAATAIIVNIIKYVPPKQPVVELFLKEKNVTFLAYTSIFAAIFGPMIEELFFRGFMYNAFKKHIGFFWAMMITSATFAALHAHSVGFVPILALGMLLAYMYERTGTLVAPVVIHMTHNLAMVALVFMVKQLGAG